MNSRIVGLVRLHLGAICAALLLPAIYFVYGQYVSSYSKTQPEKWAGDAAMFFKLAAPCVYGLGWTVQLVLRWWAKPTRTNLFLVSTVMGSATALILLADIHFRGRFSIGPSDLGVPIACLLVFILPTALFALVAGPQSESPTSSDAP